jgi:hypothetical protein
LRRHLTLHYPVRGCLLLFRASLHHRHMVWVRRITTFELSLSKSLQRSPPTQSFQVPRPLRLLLQAQGRVQLHLLYLRVPLLQLGQVWPTTLTRMTLLVSPFGLRRLSLPRSQILPLHLSRIRFLFGARCQRVRYIGGVEIGGVRGECGSLSFCSLSRFCGVS